MDALDTLGEVVVVERHYLDGVLLDEVESLRVVHASEQGWFVYEFRQRCFLTSIDPPTVEFRTAARSAA